jgi:acetyl-CoA carboxylase biotin carboxyl carrier protein
VELKQIKELMAAMGRTGIKKLQLKNKEGFELELERESNCDFRGGDSSIDFIEDNPMKNEAAQRKANTALARANDSQNTLTGGAADKEDANSLHITSPMVGTFYAAPSPEDPSFVKVGDKVDKNTVVCIIEAMKVMNEVKAGISGTVTAMLVESGHPVEFGTKLFRVS